MTDSSLADNKQKNSGNENANDEKDKSFPVLNHQASILFEDHIFDEPDDELEEFNNIDDGAECADSEADEWDEDWDAAVCQRMHAQKIAWDDDDLDDEFVKKLQEELKASQSNLSL